MSPNHSLAARLQTGSERGVAMIMAMLTVALVAILAAGIVAAYGFAVDSVSGRHDLDQARWLARGAIDWARNVLAEDKRRTGAVDQLGETWATKIPPTPVDEGEVSGEIEDLSGRFNLNSLVDASGARNIPGENAFIELLQIAGEPAGQATLLASNLRLWIDAASEPNDAYQPALPNNSVPPNAPLVTPDELIQVPGFDGALVERIKPFVTAVKPGALLNVNTASAEVLAAVLSALGRIGDPNAPAVTLDRARQIVSNRNTAAYIDIPTFVANNQDLQLPGNPASYLSVGSQYFLASGRAKFGSAVTRMQVLLDRGAPDNPSQNWPNIVWQQIL
ncbi:MAG: type II secretion system minor pseudopilin GspK [Betaproteobacteria bacterium]|nr:type II secretion system minor pseudopilin GspK [Betaproteobacteria bacterium]